MIQVYLGRKTKRIATGPIQEALRADVAQLEKLNWEQGQKRVDTEFDNYFVAFTADGSYLISYFDHDGNNWLSKPQKLGQPLVE